MERRRCLRLVAGGAIAAALSPAAPLLARSNRSNARSTAAIFALRRPGCGCCEGWADHLRENGFTVHLHDSVDLEQVKARLGIPEDIQGCHTAMVEGYVVEGHVPAEFVVRLLEETPPVSGIVVAGMPAGSPGMEGMGGSDPEPYEVVAFAGVNGAERSVFGRVNP